jgi:hypothetical protein
MVYKEYTKCVQPSNYVDLSFTLNVGISQIILLAAVYGFIAAAVILISGVGFNPAAIIAAIATVSAAITYVLWWLYGRLICLGDDDRNCAIIGMLTGAPSYPNPNYKKAGDNDKSMNLLLPFAPMNPTNPTSLDSEDKLYAEAAPQGHLVAKNSKISEVVSRGYREGSKYTKTLHCEFEGDGLYTILMALNGILIALIIWLAIVLAASTYPVAALVLFILALLGFIVYKIFFVEHGPATGAGNPLDIDPTLGSLARLDVVVLKGEWVYDSLHEGWNEIHPIRDCQILGRLEPDENGEFKWSNFRYKDKETNIEFTLDSIESFNLLHNYWCAGFKGAEDAQNNGSTTNPVHDWGIHPTVDSCKPPIIIE